VAGGGSDCVQAEQLGSKRSNRAFVFEIGKGLRGVVPAHRLHGLTEGVHERGCESKKDLALGVTLKKGNEKGNLSIKRKERRVSIREFKGPRLRRGTEWGSKQGGVVPEPLGKEGGGGRREQTADHILVAKVVGGKKVLALVGGKWDKEGNLFFLCIEETGDKNGGAAAGGGVSLPNKEGANTVD